MVSPVAVSSHVSKGEMHIQHIRRNQLRHHIFFLYDQLDLSFQRRYSRQRCHRLRHLKSRQRVSFSSSVSSQCSVDWTAARSELEYEADGAFLSTVETRACPNVSSRKHGGDDPPIVASAPRQKSQSKHRSSPSMADAGARFFDHSPLHY